MERKEFYFRKTALRSMTAPSEAAIESYITRLSYLSQPALQRLLSPMAAVRELKITWKNISAGQHPQNILDKALRSVNQDDRDNRDILLEAAALLLATPENAKNFLDAHGKAFEPLFSFLCTGGTLERDSRIMPKLEPWIMRRDEELLFYGPMALLISQDGRYILPRSLQDMLKGVTAPLQSVPATKATATGEEIASEREDERSVSELNREYHHYVVEPDALNYAYSFILAMNDLGYFKSRTTVSQKNIKLITEGTALPPNPLQEAIPNFLPVNLNFVCTSFIWVLNDKPRFLDLHGNESLLQAICSSRKSLLKNLVLETIVNKEVKFKSQYLTGKVARAFLKEYFAETSAPLQDLQAFQREYNRIWRQATGDVAPASNDSERLLTVLLFVLAGYGLYEIEWYEDPQLPAPERLRIVKASMTPLGEYVFAGKQDFVMPAPVLFPKATLDPDHLFFYAPETVSPMRYFFDSVGRALSPTRYVVTVESFFSGCNDIYDRMYRMDTFLRLTTDGLVTSHDRPRYEQIKEKLPPVWRELFDTALERQDSGEALPDFYVCLKLNPDVKGLIEFVMQNDFFQEYGIRGENYTYFFTRTQYPQAIVLLKVEGFEINSRNYFY